MKKYCISLLSIVSFLFNVNGQNNTIVTKDNFKTYLDSSRQLYREYRYKQALDLLNRLYSFDSTNIQVTNQLADLYSAYGNKKKTLYYLNKTLSVDSLNLFALVTSGDIFLRNADPGVAQAYYFRVINYVDSTNYYAYRQIANAYHGMGESFYGFALDFYKKAVQNNPYDIFSYSRMGNIYNVTNRYYEADSICNVGLKNDSLNSMLLNIKAYAQYNMKRYVDATRNFDLVFQKADTIPFSLKYAGMSYFQLNDFDKAEPLLRRCIAYDSTDYDPFIVLGKIYLQRGEYDKGLLCLKRAEKINYPPANKWSEMFKIMADIYNQQKQWDKAVDCFQQGYKLNPDDKALVCKLAYQYDYLNQKEKAIALYMKVIETADPAVYVDEVKLAKDRLQKLRSKK
ncbi:MAG TPA: hypothetical protein VHO90_04155 [Bacteroidales bacterium]|nr:hypothetical protein [Bacteroidales bacterium]